MTATDIPIRYNLEIDSDIVPTFKEWFRDKGGVVVWENQEIASGAAQEMFTPRIRTMEDGTTTDDLSKPPGWRYGNPHLVDHYSLIVSVFTPVETFRGRFKAYYWGPGLAEATEKKAERMAWLLHTQSPSEQFTYRYEFEPPYAHVTIGKIVKRRYQDFVQELPQ